MEQHEEKHARVQLKCIDRTVPLEITTEFTLPDYRSEISRLLWVRPTLLPPERFIGGGKADFSGTARFDLLYAGPDGALYGGEQESGYSFSVPLDALTGYDATAGVTLSAEPVVDAVISRVTGPRKLSVRAKVHARVRGYAEKDLSVRTGGDAAPGDGICRLCDMVQNGRCFAGGRETLTLSDNVETEGDQRLIDARGAVFLPEVIAGRDEVRCRGELILTLLLAREGEEAALPYTVTRRLPFEAAVPLEGITPDCRARATAAVGAVDAVPETGGVRVEAQVVLSAEGMGEEPILVCRDLFLPGAAAECRFAEEVFWRPALCCNRNFSISGERALAEAGVPEGAEIVDMIADAEIREKAPDGTRFTLSGELSCRLLTRRGGEYAVADAAFPFRVTIDAGCEDMIADCRVASCRFGVTPTALRVDAELQLSFCCLAETPAQVLTEATLSPAGGEERSGDPEIYYPAKEETLWDVAKRYMRAPEELAAANDMTADEPAAPDSLLGKKFLLIP